MNAILTIARMHLTLVFKDRATYVQAFAVPAVLMFILALAINEDNFSDDILVDVVDDDQSALSAEFVAALQSAGGEALVFCVYGASNMAVGCGNSSDDTFEDVGQERLEEQTVAAAIVIPTGFGEALQAGNPTAIEYRSDDQLDTSTVADTAVNTAVTQMSSSITIARAGVDGTEAYFGGYADDAARQQAFAELQQTATTALESPPAVVQRESSGEDIQPGFGARQSVPGMGSMFVLFSLLSLSHFMVEERSQGTLQRLFTMPTRKANIVVGKIFGAFLFGVLQFAIFILFGIMLDVNWGNDPLAIAALVAAFCLAGTAIGFLLSTFVRTVDQAAYMITFGGLILAPLGGAWWPLAIVPMFMRIVGQISPIAWVMDGFQELLYYNGGLADVLVEVAVLVGFAIAFTIAGIWNFRYE